MVEEEKLLLLASLMQEDTTPYISAYLDKIRTSQDYLNLLSLINKARSVPSLALSNLIYEYENLDFNNVKTFKDLIILKSKIYTLLCALEETSYFNPLLSKSKNKLGSVAININNKSITLNAFSTSEEYSDTFKIDFYKDLVNSYREEAKSLIITPLEESKVFFKKNDVHFFTFFDRLYIFILIFINILTIALPFIIQGIFTEFYELSSAFNVAIIVYFIALLTTDSYTLVHFNFYLKKYSVIHTISILQSKGSKIINSIDNKNHQLFTCLCSSLDNPQILKTPIRIFSISHTGQIAKNYLFTLIQNKDYHLCHEFINVGEKILLFLLIIIIIICVILYFVIGGHWAW